ncbi:TIGR02391 family protein [uncultured Rikenella sp.]|uniref:TIGR02391 family protein n=1 Tax=uncultured Rikenella sp. TaxID=368003 RepID=UPI00261324F2|nr:TIGR02391 family protein [uncultured Rikenella sp.]
MGDIHPTIAAATRKLFEDSHYAEAVEAAFREITVRVKRIVKIATNTSIHVTDEDFALQGGLIPEAEYSDGYTRTEHPCQTDFETFGRRINVLPKKMTEILDQFTQEQPEVYALIDRSFLDEKIKRMYKRSYEERLRKFDRESLNISILIVKLLSLQKNTIR